MSDSGNTTTGSIKIHWECPRCGHEQEEAADAGDRVYDLLEALREIAIGDGAFSRDPLTHARNCIDRMKALAEAAIAKAEGRDA